MKGFAVVTLCVIFAAIVWARPEEEKYTDQFDGIDIDEILANERLSNGYFNCLKNGKKCTPDGKLLRGKTFFQFALILNINYYCKIQCKFFR